MDELEFEEWVASVDGDLPVVEPLTADAVTRGIRDALAPESQEEGEDEEEEALPQPTTKEIWQALEVLTRPQDTQF